MSAVELGWLDKVRDDSHEVEAKVPVKVTQERQSGVVPRKVLGGGAEPPHRERDARETIRNGIEPAVGRGDVMGEEGTRHRAELRSPHGATGWITG